MLEERLIAAHKTVSSRQFEAAIPELERIIEDYPNHSGALNMLGFCFTEMEKDALGYQFFQRALQTDPNNKHILVNCGRALHELSRYDEAIQYFLKAAALDPSYTMAYSNAAASLVQMSKWEDGEKAAKLALECDPNDPNSLMNLANCYLATGRLSDGWQSMELSLGKKYRREWVYGDEPRWDGSHNKTIVIYGEQGLGDEIYYMESANDAIRDSKTVYVDCDPKLEGLFRRSFPDAHVYGTRRQESIEWLQDANIEARCAMGSLPMFYRNSPKDYTLKPYLVADPLRRMMWRAAFDSFKKPVIGVCVSGGTKKNNLAGRTIPDEAFDSLRKRYDAVWVSLEYKGDDPEWCASFPFAARSNDYDDTAALIAECDYVVGVCTTAMHCADALGVKAVTLVPDFHTWKFAGAIPFPPTSRVILQNGRSWADVIKEVSLDF